MGGGAGIYASPAGLCREKCERDVEVGVCIDSTPYTIHHSPYTIYHKPYTIYRLSSHTALHTTISRSFSMSLSLPEVGSVYAEDYLDDGSRIALTITIDRSVPERTSAK
ncbi:hypothetical protein EON63_17545 [archaeon]|nr:MAG: hypothetical protein EON63_17545 [archaeon]